MFKNMRIGAKLITVGTIIMIVPLLVVAFIGVTRSTTGLTAIEKEQLGARAKDIAQTIDRVFAEESRIALSLAVDPDIVAAAAAETDKGAAKSQKELATAYRRLSIFHTNQDLGGVFERVILVGAGGSVIVSSDNSDVGLNLREREYVKDGLEGKASLGQVVVSKVSGKPISPVAMPVKDGSRVVGVAALIVNIGFLNDMIVKETIGKTGYAYVIDRTGLIIAHPKAENILKMNLLEQKGSEGFANKMVKGESGVDHYIFQGVPKTARIVAGDIDRMKRRLHPPRRRVPGNSLRGPKPDHDRGLCGCCCSLSRVPSFLPGNHEAHQAWCRVRGAGGRRRFHQQLAIHQRDEVGKLAGRAQLHVGQAEGHGGHHPGERRAGGGLQRADLRERPVPGRRRPEPGLHAGGDERLRGGADRVRGPGERATRSPRRRPSSRAPAPWRRCRSPSTRSPAA